MIHAVTYVIFALVFTKYLGWELGKKYSFKKYWLWIGAAFITGLIGSYTYSINYNATGNFLLHASGGASATFLFVYVFKTLRIKFNWRLTLLLLFVFVSTLGVMNELAEYFFEILGYGTFSDDTHDTWRDFVANTTGMIVAWTTLNLMKLVDKT